MGMYRFLLRRLVASLFTLLVISLLVFLLARGSGDPRSLMLDDYADPGQWEEVGAKLGLDKPWFISWPPWESQYGIFLVNAFRLDFGNAISDPRTVSELILERLPATLQLGLAAFIFSIVIGVPLGILSSLKRNSIWDNMGKLVALLGQSMPPFWLGIMLIFLFALRFEWVPPSGRQDWNSFILPAITLGWFFVAANMRLIRSAMLEVLDSEYIKLARAKGVSPPVVVWKHALRNALIPPLTFMGVTLGLLITGSIVAETVFQWPGLGLLAYTALIRSDYPTLQGIVMVFSGMYLIINFLVDILYAYIDPRIRYS